MFASQCFDCLWCSGECWCPGWKSSHFLARVYSPLVIWYVVISPIVDGMCRATKRHKIISIVIKISSGHFWLCSLSDGIWAKIHHHSFEIFRPIWALSLFWYSLMSAEIFWLALFFLLFLPRCTSLEFTMYPEKCTLPSIALFWEGLKSDPVANVNLLSVFMCSVPIDSNDLWSV